MARIHIDHCKVCSSDQLGVFLDVVDHTVSKETFRLVRCQACDFVFTQDPPDESSIGVYYKSESYISHSDTNKGIINFIYHYARRIMLRRKSYLFQNKDTKKNLLDVGSGTGYFLEYMKKKGYQVVGIEVDDQVRLNSIKRFNVEVYPPSKLADDGFTQKFGFITLWHVLEHIYDPNAYMKKFHDLLEENGRLILALPNHTCLDARYYSGYWAGYDVPLHLWHFTPKTLEKFAVKHGFVLEKKVKMPFDPFHNSMLSEKFQGNSFAFIRGAFIGALALLESMFSTEKASSIIYILKKR